MCAQTLQPRDRGKNKQGPRVQAESSGLKECHKNLIALLDLCNNAFRGIWTKQRLSQRRRTTAWQRRDTQHGLAEAKHQETQQGKYWPKTSRNIDSTYHETLKNVSTDSRAHGVFSTRGQNVACVCRDFTAARRDNKATKMAQWLGGVSKAARVTLRVTKHEIPRKSSRDTCREPTGKGDTLQLTLQT